MNMPVKKGNSQGWIPSIFNDFFDTDWMVRTNATAPAINVIETDKEYTVEVAAPGMTKSDFNIQIDAQNDLVITMEKECNCGDNCQCEDDKKSPECTAEDAAKGKCKETKEDDAKGRYLRREFSYSKFRQTLILPDDVAVDKIEAKVNDGVLTINIPKKSPAQPKNVTHKININ